MDGNLPFKDRQACEYHRPVDCALVIGAHLMYRLANPFGSRCLSVMGLHICHWAKVPQFR